jgi:hypothetical protein
MPDEHRLEAKHSWFKFFPSDWLGDELLAMSTYAERGLLIELLCLMHKSARYGYLLVNGRPPTDQELTRLTRGGSVRETRKTLAKLVAKGVLSVDHEIVYSRRMVRARQQSDKGRENGKLGGNPALKGLSGGDNHNAPRPDNRGDNPQIPEARSQKLDPDPRTTRGVLPDPSAAAAATPGPRPVTRPTPVQGPGAGAGSYPRDHLRCQQPCGRVCLPDTLFAEFVRARGGPPDEAAAHVRAWHDQVNAVWGEGGANYTQPVGDDKFTFWRARWREDHGTTASASTDKSLFEPGTRTEDLAAALREGLKERRR